MTIAGLDGIGRGLRGYRASVPPESAKFLSGEGLTVSSEVTYSAAEQKVMEARRQAIYALPAFCAASFLTTPRAQPTFD